MTWVVDMGFALHLRRLYFRGLAGEPAVYDSLVGRGGSLIRHLPGLSCAHGEARPELCPRLPLRALLGQGRGDPRGMLLLQPLPSLLLLPPPLLFVLSVRCFNHCHRPLATLASQVYKKYQKHEVVLGTGAHWYYKGNQHEEKRAEPVQASHGSTVSPRGVS